MGHLMRRVDSLEKTLMLGGIEGQEKGMTTLAIPKDIPLIEHYHNILWLEEMKTKTLVP